MPTHSKISRLRFEHNFARLRPVARVVTSSNVVMRILFVAAVIFCTADQRVQLSDAATVVDAADRSMRIARGSSSRSFRRHGKENLDLTRLDPRADAALARGARSRVLQSKGGGSTVDSETQALRAFRDAQPPSTRAPGGCLQSWTSGSPCAGWRGVSL